MTVAREFRVLQARGKCPSSHRAQGNPAGADAGNLDRPTAGDLLRLPWSAYDGTLIRLHQSKTGRRIVMPAGAPLKALWDLTERRGPVILTNTMGRPWTADGSRSSWGKLSDRADVGDWRKEFIGLSSRRSQ
jgi:hypothetical protein